MNPKPIYLTKSLFKTALECPTKLYYQNPKNGYFNKKKDNEFLEALANGGHQVGELAKFKYHDDPVGASITVTERNHQAAIAATRNLLGASDRAVIAEAALQVDKLFARVDILIKDDQKNTVELLEVKSKKVTEKQVKNRFKNRNGYEKGWLPYLYDIAFQTEMALRVFPDHQVIPKLVLLDSEAACDVDQLYQRFPVVYDNANGGFEYSVRCDPKLRRNALGRLDSLREITVTDIVDELRNSPIQGFPHVPTGASQNLQSCISWASDLLQSGTREFVKVSKLCAGCEFRSEKIEDGKSGVHQCWQEAIDHGLLEEPERHLSYAEPLSIDLWGGKTGNKSIKQTVIDARRALLVDIAEEDIRPKSERETIGLSPYGRRIAQISAAKEADRAYELSEQRLEVMNQWEWPLHMIDFETSTPAIPFFKDMKPYETLAFQFSHHIMERNADGTVSIRHANQWISTSPNAFPNVEFVRHLRKALMPTGELKGTVFRFHNHERSVLNFLKGSFTKLPSDVVPDLDHLTRFIDLLAGDAEPEEKRIGRASDGSRPMVDLHLLLEESYYGAKSNGSGSLKDILPAILSDADSVAQLYSKEGLYGTGLLINSLNFTEPQGHIWLSEETGNDPYKTLPPIFPSDWGQLNEMLMGLVDDEDDNSSIAQGGAAMTAYNITQFSNLQDVERDKIKDALLRYCELDTLAMVIAVQGLYELSGKPLTISGQ